MQPIKECLFIEKEGKPIAISQNTDARRISLQFEEFRNGYACRVTAHSKNGFFADAAVLLRPKEKDASSYLAIQNHSPFWCRPFWGASLSALPNLTQMLLLKKEAGYACYLPLCDNTFKTVVRGYEGGMEFCLYANCEGLTDCENQLAYIYMEDKDADKLLRAVAEKAAELLNNGLKMREERRMPEVFEYLGWCSWDALHIHVNHEGLLEKAKEFAEKKIPVHYAIIDDMWADAPNLLNIPLGTEFGKMVEMMHQSKLHAFQGDPVRFPKGMKAAVADLKKAGIPKVGIWFPTTGYWSGLDPEGPDAALLKEDLVETNRGLAVAPNEKSAFRYFNTFCRRIRAWGGDFVKIDNQGCHSRYRNVAPIGQSSRALQYAIDSTTGCHFDGALINCMGMPSECMFNRPSSPISRCSDDFQPESRAWFSKNILQCAYNGLLQGQYYINDWDMWWSDDEQAVKNSLCRALSGGPVYVSDKIGRSNPEIFKPVILSDGRLLRCDNSATPTVDCLTENPTESNRILKIRNRVGKAGLIAAFNINAENKAQNGILSPADAGLPAGRYAYYEYFTKQSGLLNEGETIALTLENNDVFRLYTFVPIENGLAALGRTDKFIGVKAINAVANYHYVLAEGGECSFVSEKEIEIYTDKEKLPVKKNGLLYTVKTKKEETFLRVAIE